MSNTDDLRYNFAAIESVQAAVNQFCDQMDSHLAEVDGKFQGMLSDGWSGPAADAFQGASQKWHKGAENMRLTLTQLAGKVGNASVNFQQADHDAMLRFS